MGWVTAPRSLRYTPKITALLRTAMNSETRLDKLRTRVTYLEGDLLLLFGLFFNLATLKR